MKNIDIQDLISIPRVFFGKLMQQIDFFLSFLPKLKIITEEFRV